MAQIFLIFEALEPKLKLPLDISILKMPDFGELSYVRVIYRLLFIDD